MASIAKTQVTLRIASATLEPAKITALLGHEPSKARRRGEKFDGANATSGVFLEFGQWTLNGTDSEPEDLNTQISEVLKLLTLDLNIWKSISSEHRVDLFCSLSMQQTDEGLTLEADVMKAISERGISLGLNIYAPLQE